MTTAQQTAPGLLNVVIEDWSLQQEAHLSNVSRHATVGEIVREAVRALELPSRSPFQALHRGRQLNPSETLDEVGIETDDRIEILPEVTAGRTV